MTRPDQIATVTANGQRYSTWTEIECTRSAVDVVDHAMLTVSEISPKTSNAITSLKLQPGDNVTVSLAGMKIIDGLVYLRQAVLDANNHAIQIGVASVAQSIMSATVSGSPGQFVNQTLQQIGSSVFGQIGINFTVLASGDMPFPRVSQHIGENMFSFVERLCRMSNMHMIDDGNGGVVAFRGAASSTITLDEGKFLSGRIILKNNNHVDDIRVHGHDAGNDSADMNRGPTGTSFSDPPIRRQFRLVAEEMGNSARMQMRANHQADWDKFMQVDGDIAVTDWFAPDGSLWWSNVTKQIIVNSPSLLPKNTFGFMIKSVTHRKSIEGGTTTDIGLARHDAFGSGAGEPTIVGPSQSQATST